MEITDIQKDIEDLENTLRLVRSKAAGIQKEIAKGEKETKGAADMLGEKFGKNFLADNFLSFFKKPYVTIPGGRNEVFVAVPKFIRNFQVGWLERETETFFIYRFNQYSSWLGDAPEDLLKEIDFTPDFQATVEGNRISFDRSQRDAIKKKLGHLISEGTLEDTTAIIKKGRQFDVIADIIKNGCLPFKAHPVSKEDLRPARHEFKARAYQQPVIDEFLRTGAVGAFHPTGAGKSFIGMHIMDIVKGPKLLFVPNLTLKEQWHAYIEANVPHLKSEIGVHLYNSPSSKFKESYALTVYDECHRLPADTFSRLALINTRYRLGLSASPNREDGREHYIFALTGFPVGLNWSDYMKEAGKEYHPIHVWVCASTADKMRKLDQLLNMKKRTFVFCDSINLGREISRKYEIPFIHGETPERMRLINENTVVAISRVGDEGVSVKDLQQIIEIDFLGGSRRQELQRTGRLMHSEDAERHDILMTEKELKDHGRRIWSLQEKGFTVKVHA